MTGNPPKWLRVIGGRAQAVRLEEMADSIARGLPWTSEVRGDDAYFDFESADDFARFLADVTLTLRLPVELSD